MKSRATTIVYAFDAGVPNSASWTALSHAPAGRSISGSSFEPIAHAIGDFRKKFQHIGVSENIFAPENIGA
jgi:hypothetical protein